MTLSTKDFLTIANYEKEEIQSLLKLSKEVKKSRNKAYRETLDGKTIGLIFTKPSTRTRVSFEVGIKELGGYPLFLSSGQMQTEKGETIKDTAKVLSRYLHGLVIRTFKQTEVEEYAKYLDGPVINALTDEFHPCQALADFLTIDEKIGISNKKKIVFVGDGNNVASCLFLTGALFNMEMVLSCPKEYEIPLNVQKIINEKINKYGGSFTIEYDSKKAVKNADVIYTDTWISMGQEKETKKRKNDFKNYQVNDFLVKNAGDQVIIMHCLPAYRDQEITESVIDGEKSVVFDQAENRLHAQKAVLLALFDRKK